MPPPQRSEDEEKPCRACSDFKSWAKMNRNKGAGSSSNEPLPDLEKPKRKDCPLDKDDVGRSTWSFLHSMAAYFPEKPTKVQSEEMARFFNIFAQFYPCEPCAIDFQKDIGNNPPRTLSQEDLAKWLCERHNTVNIKLGKPVFDCSKVNERWRDGWKDGSCD